jgi:PAS domain S-box-containing protein
MYEGPLKTRSGEVRTILWANSSILANNAYEIVASAVGQDITDRKQAEEALAESEENYRLLVENVESAISRFDRNGIIQFVNTFLSRQFGVPVSEMVGRSITDFFKVNTSRMILEQLHKVIESGKPFTGEFMVPIRDEERWHHATIQPYFDAQGEIAGAMVIADDITESKKIQRKLEKAHEELKNEQESLKQANIALRQIITNVEGEKDAIKRQIQENIDKILTPMLVKLESRLGTEHKKSLNLIQECFTDIASPYLDQLGRRSMSLTDNELRICTLIARGHGTSEIASLLNISARTVEKHRQQIRKKLSLTGTKTNLQSYLTSIREELSREAQSRRTTRSLTTQ